MAYHARTHKADKIAGKQLFIINGITDEEMLENLSILLDDENDVCTSTIANFPTNLITAGKDYLPSQMSRLCGAFQKFIV